MLPMRRAWNKIQLQFEDRMQGGILRKFSCFLGYREYAGVLLFRREAPPRPRREPKQKNREAAKILSMQTFFLFIRKGYKAAKAFPVGEGDRRNSTF